LVVAVKSDVCSTSGVTLDRFLFPYQPPLHPLLAQEENKAATAKRVKAKTKFDFFIKRLLNELDIKLGYSIGC